MKKFNTYSEFLSEGIEDIFRGAHAAIDPDDLVPIQDVLDRPKFPTQEQFDEVVDFLKADPEHFFYDSSNMLHPFIYWKGPVFHAFFGGLNIEAMKMMKDDKRLEYHQSRAEKDLKANNYVDLFNHMDKKILIPNFIEMYKQIPDNQKYDVFIDLYVRSEYGFSSFPKSLIEDLFAKRTLSSEWKKRMAQFEKKIKINPKGMIRIYRGENKQSASSDQAYSWSLSRKTAEFFANRFSKGAGNVISKMIDLRDVLDYIDDRSEAEVLVLPTKYLKESKFNIIRSWVYDNNYPSLTFYSKERPKKFIFAQDEILGVGLNSSAVPFPWFKLSTDSGLEIMDTSTDERTIFIDIMKMLSSYTSITADGKFPSLYDDSIKTETSLTENPAFKEWWERCKEKYKTFAAATKLGLLESEEGEDENGEKVNKEIQKLVDGFKNEDEIVKAIELNGFKKLPPTGRGGDYVFLDPSRRVKYVSSSSGYVRYYDPTARQWRTGQSVTTKTPIHTGLVKSQMDRLAMILRRAMKANDSYSGWKKSGLSGKDFIEKNTTRLTAKSIGLL
jgi:hypothetical protein